MMFIRQKANEKKKSLALVVLAIYRVKSESIYLLLKGDFFALG